MPSIEELVSDQSQHVRAALGTQISGLAPILGKEEYVPETRDHVLADSIQNHFTPSSNVSSDAEGRVSRRSTQHYLETRVR
jgi:hypothetical protein